MAREIWRQQRHDPTHLSVHRPLYLSKRLSVDLGPDVGLECSLLLAALSVPAGGGVAGGGRPCPGFLWW